MRRGFVGTISAADWVGTISAADWVVRHTPRFRYASSDIHVYLEPAYLAFVGGFSLLPEIKVMDVFFTAGQQQYAASYNYSAPVYVGTGKDKVLTYNSEKLESQVFAKLYAALTPPGQTNIRGKLMHLEKKEHHQGIGRAYQYKERTMVDKQDNTARAASIDCFAKCRPSCRSLHESFAVDLVVPRLTGAVCRLPCNTARTMFR